MEWTKGEGVGEKSDVSYTNSSIYFFSRNSIFLSLLCVELLSYYSERATKKTYQEPISVFEITIEYLHKNIIIPLLSQYGLSIYTCVSKNAILSKDEIFYLPWYNVIRWSSHIYKIYSFLSFHSLRFSGNNTRKATKKNWENETQVEWNGMGNLIMQVTYFFNGSMANLLFHCHIFRYWKKVTS